MPQFDSNLQTFRERHSVSYDPTPSAAAPNAQQKAKNGGTTSESRNNPYFKLKLKPIESTNVDGNGADLSKFVANDLTQDSHMMEMGGIFKS